MNRWKSKCTYILNWMFRTYQNLLAVGHQVSPQQHSFTTWSQDSLSSHFDLAVRSPGWFCLFWSRKLWRCFSHGDQFYTLVVFSQVYFWRSRESMVLPLELDNKLFIINFVYNWIKKQYPPIEIELILLWSKRWKLNVNAVVFFSNWRKWQQTLQNTPSTNLLLPYTNQIFFWMS